MNVRLMGKPFLQALVWQTKSLMLFAAGSL
jgi:hypothetical protein